MEVNLDISDICPLISIPTPRAWADGLEQLCAQDRTETAAVLLLDDHLVKATRNIRVNSLNAIKI